MYIRYLLCGLYNVNLIKKYVAYVTCNKEFLFFFYLHHVWFKINNIFVILEIYVHIELNLIPMVVTLVWIIIKIFLFVMSNEISVTLKQNYFWHQFFRKLICSFQTEKSNQLFQTYNSNKFVLIYLISLYSFLKNFGDKLEATNFWLYLLLLIKKLSFD